MAEEVFSTFFLESKYPYKLRSFYLNDQWVYDCLTANKLKLSIFVEFCQNLLKAHCLNYWPIIKLNLAGWKIAWRLLVFWKSSAFVYITKCISLTYFRNKWLVSNLFRLKLLRFRMLHKANKTAMIDEVYTCRVLLNFLLEPLSLLQLL
jgi:hypothetical protein